MNNRIYCTNPEHSYGEHDVTCIPPAEPDNPELRLIRTIFGLCPTCDQVSEHVHFSEWHDSLNEEPRDQDKDLTEGYWAEVGPYVPDDPPNSWAWSILIGSEGEIVAGGPAPSEEEAKAAVNNWEKENLKGRNRE